MKIKRFNEINESYSFAINFIRATAMYVVEYGDVEIEINGIETNLKIEEVDNGDFSVYMNKMDFDELNIDIETELPNDYEISGEIRILDEDFISNVQNYYRENSPRR